MDKGLGIILLSEFGAIEIEIAKREAGDWIALILKGSQVMDIEGFAFFFMGDFAILITTAVGSRGLRILIHEFLAIESKIHLFHQRFADFNARSIADNRVHAAFWAKGGHATLIVNPFLDVSGVIYLTAEIAAAFLGLDDFDFVVFRVLFVAKQKSEAVLRGLPFFDVIRAL